MKQSQGLCCSYLKSEVNSSKRWIAILHGWDNQGHSSWQQTVIRLNSRGFNVLALDLPGFGKSESPGSVWNTVDYARFVNGFLKDVDIDPVLILGHGFGGSVALRMAGDKMSTYKGLILVSPILSYDVPTLTPSQIFKLRLKRMYQYMLKYPVINRLLRSVRELVRPFFGPVEYQKSTGIMHKILKNIRKEDVSEILPYVRIPTLLIWGSKDIYNPLTNAQKMVSELSDSEIKVYDNVGFNLQIIEPDQLSRDVFEFFDTNKYTFAIT